MTALRYLGAPPTVAVAVVLTLYVDSGSLLGGALRSLAVALLLGMIIAVGLLPLVGLRKAALWGSLLVLVMAESIPLAALLVAACVYVVSLLMQRTGRPQMQGAVEFLERAAPTLAALLLVVVVGSGVANGSLGLPALRPPPAIPTEANEGPDIFVILLDGYPAVDTLSERFDFDDGPFLAALVERGFHFAGQSRSNYNLTGHSLTSMFHMRHLHDIPAVEDGPRGRAPGYRTLGEVLSAPLPAFELLRRHGYETTTIPSLTDTYRIDAADRVIDTADPNAFELHVLGRTILGPLIDWVAPDLLYDQQRERSLAALDTTVRLAGDDGRPQLVFTHLMLPHAPFLFGPNGEELDPRDCFPSDCTIYDPPPDLAEHLIRYRDQVQFLNDRILALIDAIRDNSAEAPVIVLFSDHGSRIFSDDLDETFHNFFAAATPGHTRVFPDDVTPVNVFPYLARAYFDEDVALQPNLFFITRSSEEPLLREPVTDP